MTPFRLSTGQKTELESAMKNKKYQKFTRHIQAVLLRGTGYSLKEVMALTGYSDWTVRDLIKRYRLLGLAGLLIDKRHGGQRQYLTDEEEEAFFSQFLADAQRGQITDVKTMHAAYEERVGKKTHLNSFYKLLRRHGWRKIKPRPKHPKQAAAEEILERKKLTQKVKN